jgi:hypothetical protein
MIAPNPSRGIRVNIHRMPPLQGFDNPVFYLFKDERQTMFVAILTKLLHVFSISFGERSMRDDAHKIYKTNHILGRFFVNIDITSVYALLNPPKISHQLEMALPLNNYLRVLC